MSLASALLKRLFVHTTLGYPWHAIRFGRKRDPKHGKPCALLPAPLLGPAPVEFNVSHQAGLVALVGCATAHLDAELGVDIVCVNERNDTRAIDTDGLDAWIDVFESMFSPAELFDMKYTADTFPLADGTLVTPALLGRHDRCTARNVPISLVLPNGGQRVISSNALIDAKLRRFYTYWCYKEAYIKLDGEAMLATWIPRLEFRGVRAPLAASSFASISASTSASNSASASASASATTSATTTTTPLGQEQGQENRGPWGERVDDAETWFEQQRLGDVRVEIQAFEDAFMIGVAAKLRVWGGDGGGGVGGALPGVLTRFESLDIDHVLRVAGG
jgi:4'-phosphopantetheinyl transferase